MKHPRRVNIPMCLAGILFCLTMISIHFTSGLYAKYTTKYGSEDSARVAKFEVTEDKTSFHELLMIPLEPGTFPGTIQVENKSEVAINYVVTVKNVTKNIPLQFQVGEASATQDEHVSTNSIPANVGKSIVMNIIWPQEGSLQYIGMVDVIEITVEAVQID